jgi:hypothetical protein
MVLASSRIADPSSNSRSPSFVWKGTSLRVDLLEGIPMVPTSVREAFECLAAVSSRLRSQGDPRAAFTDVYAIITRRVRDAIEGPASECPFVEPQFISRLAGRFCTLYLAALRRSLAGAQEPVRAWRIANREDGSQRTAHGDRSRALPFQHALLGLNAHINYDLALGLLDNVSALGAAEDDARMARYRHDHDAVNQILEDAIPEVLSLLDERYGCGAAHFVLRADDLRRATSSFTMLVLRTWRARVWRDLRGMLSARDEAAKDRILSWMNMRAGLFASLLKLPLPIPAARAPSGHRSHPTGGELSPAEEPLPVAA